jgi:prophage maintenance system killer protein
VPKRGYDQLHGDPGGILRPDEEREAALPAAAGPSLHVPSIEELEGLNRRIHEDDGLPGAFALDQRAPLLGRLEAARAVDTSALGGVLKAAALLAHGIAQSQSFRDGNRRTAFIATQAFLEKHGVAYISRGEDDMLTRYLNQVVERQGRFTLRRPPGPDKFEELFRRRLENRTPPAPEPDTAGE